MVDGLDTTTSNPEVPLTDREREVALLMAEGLTNAEVSERLGITFATAKWHVSQVLSKLAVERREDVAVHLERPRHERRRTSGWPRWGLFPFAKVLGIAAAVVPVGVLAVGGFFVMTSRGDSASDPIAVLASSSPGPIEALRSPTPQPNVKPHTCDWRSGQVDLNGGASDHSGCDFSGVEFGAANLNRAHLDSTILVGAIFQGSTLGGANLTGVDARRAKFLDAILQNTNFDGADLTGATFTNSIVLGATYRGATCPDGQPAATRGDTCAGTPGLKNLPTTRSLGAAKKLEGQPAPDFSATSIMDGKTAVALSELRGQAVVLWWFSSACQACTGQAEEIQGASLTYPDVVFLAVALGEDRNEARAFLNDQNLTISGVFDNDAEIAAAYGVVGLPTTVIIDANGIYKTSRVGSYNQTTLDDLLLRSGISE